MFIFAINIVAIFVISNLLATNIAYNSKLFIKYEYRDIFCKTNNRI